MNELPSWLNADIPGTSRAASHVPSVSSATNTSAMSEAGQYVPIAVQLPADAQDSASTSAPLPASP